MMERMDDLVQFLRDRYNDDERVARATDDTMGQLQLNWSARPEDEAFSKVVAGGRYNVARELTPADAAHIARQDPARVLAEVEAKRQLVKLHGPATLRAGGGAQHFATQTVCRSCEPNHQFPEQSWPCATLRVLALPYTDHPGYRQDWRP